jgi:hypothetical protein
MFLHVGLLGLSVVFAIGVLGFVMSGWTGLAVLAVFAILGMSLFALFAIMDFASVREVRVLKSGQIRFLTRRTTDVSPHDVLRIVHIVPWFPVGPTSQRFRIEHRRGSVKVSGLEAEMLVARLVELNPGVGYATEQEPAPPDGGDGAD